MACGAAKKGATRACGAATACVGLAGAGVLVWWTVAFHPAHEQLWMVPVGLVLLGTPLIAGISLFASGRRDQAPAVVASAET